MNHRLVRFSGLYMVCFMSLLAAVGCGSGDDTASSPAHKTGLEPVFPVAVTKAASDRVEHTLEAVGSFLPAEEVTIGAEVAGTIKKLHVDEGTHVKEAQQLLQINDIKVRLDVAENQAMLHEAIAKRSNAELTFTRISKLFSDGVIGQNDFDDAQTQVALSRAVVEEMRARLNHSKQSLQDTRVIAPLAGVISSRFVSVGEYVKVGAELFKIVDSNPLKLVFSIPEKYTGDIKKGQKVSITTQAYPGKLFEGTVYFISPVVDHDTRTIEVKAWVENNDYRLKPGFFVDVAVSLGLRDSLVLPESAVVVREGRVLVMTVKDGIVAYKKIVPGMRFDEKVEILEGISAGDVVITSGRSEIEEGTKVNITASP